MRYYLIAGEASGDLHAAALMQALKQRDTDAQFRFIGGDEMQAQANDGAMVKHYRELAYMGFIPVLLHLPTILRNMKHCKHDIRQWQPDVVILVDYPGFNLSIAKFVKANAICPVFYYISPKIWAWKEYRIKNIRRDVDQLFSILPFEVDFFEKKHHYPIHYVGNPTASEVRAYRNSAEATATDFHDRNNLTAGKPIIALLCGSRKQEIKDNLPTMLRATAGFADAYTVAVAGAPGISPDYYTPLLAGSHASIVFGQTYALLSHAHAALVTSGTATLETALFGVPQVVCYKTPLPHLVGWLRKKLLKVRYVSLVNLVADREIVTELVAETFTQANMEAELRKILGGPDRQRMLDGYAEVECILGDSSAPAYAAEGMWRLLAQ